MLSAQCWRGTLGGLDLGFGADNMIQHEYSTRVLYRLENAEWYVAQSDTLYGHRLTWL